MDKYVVALKIKGKISPTYQFQAYSYLKAKQIDENILDINNLKLSEPIKGEQYVACNLFTSNVIDYKPFKDGWEVQTENSLYRFYYSNMDEIEAIVKENNFRGPKSMGFGLYWS